MKLSIYAILGGAAMLFAGCVTSPVSFIPSSVPIPEEGYTVCGREVTGQCKQIWVFGFGGNSTVACQSRAHDDAMKATFGADALIGVSVERAIFSIPPFFTRVAVRLTGTPVKFNKVNEQ